MNDDFINYIFDIENKESMLQENTDALIVKYKKQFVRDFVNFIVKNLNDDDLEKEPMYQINMISYTDESGCMLSSSTLNYYIPSQCKEYPIKLVLHPHDYNLEDIINNILIIEKRNRTIKKVIDVS